MPACIDPGTPLPSWLPPLVDGVESLCGDSGGSGVVHAFDASGGLDQLSEGMAMGPGVESLYFPLSGEANQDTQIDEPLTDEQIDSGLHHPGEAIQLYIYPRGASGLVLDADEFLTVEEVTLDNGLPAVVNSFTNGLGPVRVTWTDGQHSYLLMTIIRDTGHGLSGVTKEELLRMAGSFAVG